jgi:hypothetical protein
MLRGPVRGKFFPEPSGARQALRRHKEALRVESFQERIVKKTASDRDFVLTEKGWVDQTIGERKKVISVKSWSEAYFEVLRLRPDLKEAPGLGEEVEIRLDNQTVLRLSALNGKEGLSKEDRGLLEKTRPRLQ